MGQILSEAVKTQGLRSSVPAEYVKSFKYNADEQLKEAIDEIGSKTEHVVAAETYQQSITPTRFLTSAILATLNIMIVLFRFESTEIHHPTICLRQFTISSSSLLDLGDLREVLSMNF